MRYLSVFLLFGLFLITCVENKPHKPVEESPAQDSAPAKKPEDTQDEGDVTEAPALQPDNASKPAPKTCDDIDAIKPCTESTFNCEWDSTTGKCQKIPPAPLPPPPKFACSQFETDTDCNGSLLGCQWDPKDKECKESSVISAQSCFQANNKKACTAPALKTVGCRWQRFSALKTSKCIPSYVPNDPELQYQWHLLNKEWGQKAGINAIDAWSITRGDPKVVIGVLDEGFPPNYKDFEVGCTNRSITIQPLNNPKSGDHGLWVSSVAAACSNIGVGMSGVDQLSSVLAAWVPYDPYDKTFAPDDYREGFRWFLNIKKYKTNTKPLPHVINLSLGGRQYINAEFGHFAGISIKKNITVVSAAGNDGFNIVQFKTPYPTVDNISVIPGVISVGATDKRGNATNFSNWGPFVDIMAPGKSIAVTSIKNPGQTENIDGTSFSSPIITGVVALMKSVFPGLTPQIARHILRRTARPMTCGQLCPADRGSKKTPKCKADMCPAANKYKLWRPTGLVDAYAAVRMAKQMYERGTPSEPIIQSDLYWVGIGTKGELYPPKANNAQITLTNYGSANGTIRLAANQDANVSIFNKNGSTSTAIAANKSEKFGIKYAGAITNQKAMPIYFEVLDDAGKYIDSFAILLIVAQ